MAKTYVLILSNPKFNREKLTDILKQDYRMTDWGYCLPNTLFISGDYLAKDISDLLEKNFGVQKHVVIEVSKSNYWGRLPQTFWRHFQ